MIRNSLLLSCLILLGSHLAAAQHPLIGTWEMVSIAGTNVDGQKFNLDSTAIHETKIITPSHYILIAADKEDEKWKFNRCYFGRTKIEDDKYYEIPIMSSQPIYENVKTDFSWKIDGREFIQSGFITRPDGKTIILEKFIFGRNQTSPVADKKFVGTWKAEQGGIKSYLVITATHWMSIEQENQKFSRASGGVYSTKGSRAELTVLYGSENKKNSFAQLQGQAINFNNLSYSKED